MREEGSAVFSTLATAAREAPVEIPTKMPSSLAARLAYSKASVVSTGIAAFQFYPHIIGPRKKFPDAYMWCAPNGVNDTFVFQVNFPFFFDDFFLSLTSTRWFLYTRELGCMLSVIQVFPPTTVW